MASDYDNDDVACYFTTKHSWRGKYKRVFSIGSEAITTYNPSTFEVTNQWPYKDFHNIVPSSKAPYELTIVVKKTKEGKKIHNMTFSTEYRVDLLTDALRFYKQFAGYKSGNELRYSGYKLHWSERKVPVVLEVSPGSLDQIDPRDNKKLCSYNYKDIELIALVSDHPGGFAVVYGGFSRMHLFTTDRREEILKKIMEAAFNNIGVTVKQKKSAIKVESFLKYKFGKFSDDEHITSMAEFNVYKQTPRAKDPVPRTLCFSEMCLLERDPATYNIVTLHPLSSIFSIIRYRDHPQLLGLEYIDGTVRKYSSPDRDTLLAGLLDGVRASGNRDVCVKTTPTKKGYRWGPLHHVVDEEVESSHLKFLASPPGTFTEAVYRFNCNISYSGLLHAVTQDGLFSENKERLIIGAITMLLAHEGDQTKITNKDLEAQFHALRRLVASKAGFRAFTTLPGFREKVGLKVVKALKRSNEAVNHAAVDMVCTLMQPMHDNYDIRQEQLNKASLLSSEKFLTTLLDILTTNVNRSTGALVISALLDFLTFSLCPPYSETTDDEQFNKLLEKVADMGRCIYRLFQHPSTTIVKGAGMVLKAIIEEGDEETAAKMQDLALAEGALPRHLHMAMFTKSTDKRLLMNRQLSRHLVGLWTTGHPTAVALLKRIMPAGLMYFLESTEEPPQTETDQLAIRDNVKLAETSARSKGSLRNQLEKHLSHWRTKMGFKSKKEVNQKPVVLRNSKKNIKTEQNWDLFYYKFNQDISTYNLIWNYKTREELRGALESEMRAFSMDKDLSGNYVVSWNHQEFEVLYECLSDELKIGDYFLRILLEQNDEETPITNALEFFNDLYHRFLLTTKSGMKAMCLQAMTKVYGKCHEEIGAFNDTKYIVGMLDRSERLVPIYQPINMQMLNTEASSFSRYLLGRIYVWLNPFESNAITSDKLERDRLLFFLNELTKHQRNVKALLDVNAIKNLVELMTLAHLHTTRATVPLQTNVLEAAPESGMSGEKEWYYGNKEKERLGPFSFDEMKEFWKEEEINPSTRCWCQGMDGWRPVQNIPQLKWYLLASGSSLMNETDMTVLILNMMIRICSYYPNRDVDGAIIRPLPRAKRMLSEAICLPHIVQLLLTFDPIIVEKVAVLLNDILLDNPVIPRLYLTGVFFFIMMYTGSNLLPIGKFLAETHMKQSFRSEENQGGEISQRSILGPILPEAMICYLENHGCDKFSSVFLGEFDTPEAIWSNEMRRFMIGQIASHLVDFTPRLRSNTKALYQYCPIPVVSYLPLENELFCNIYYLRHLCDTQRFPDWPIQEPVKFLKNLLEAWKAEVEKKPPTLSVEEALKILNLKKKPEEYDQAKIRKAYFRMAQKYHPDKNPEGREIFEQVSKAYEFLCSKSSRNTLGPDPANIVLILRAQSILFSRCKEVLEPYKYSGYPMLIKTIQMELDDSQSFSKENALLPSACELCYHTVNTSALNAEELRRESGIKTLQVALSRAVDLVDKSSKADEIPVQVCCHIIHCYAVASQFEKCREMIAESQIIVQELCRILYYKNVPNMCILGAECVSSFSVDFWLQTHLLQAGVLWHLLLYMFNYDYTLEEGGVEASSETNQQEIANELARVSVRAVARLGGYFGDETTPENPAIKKSLDAMLTPYLARKLHSTTSQELLKLLNSNTQNPNLIWDNGTRGEIMKYLEEEQDRKISTGDCDPSFGADFTYSLYEKELIVGEIFVRIYNEQPSFPLENPKKFTSDLLNFIGNQAQYLHSLLQLKATSNDTMDSGTQQQRFEHVAMALEALRNVIKSSPGVEEKCIGQFKLIFSLLRMSEAIKLQQLALETQKIMLAYASLRLVKVTSRDQDTRYLAENKEVPDRDTDVPPVINNVTGNKNCVSDIADSNVISYLLLTLYTLPSSRPLVSETLHALCSNTKIVKEAHNKGALVYLLNLFCNSSNPIVRAKAAELFNKMMADKLVGPKVKITLSKFLPIIFLDAMRENPDVSIHMFEGSHENPELIWNDESREKVCGVVKRERDTFYNKQKDDPEASWKLPDDFEVVFGNVEGELIIGGVFLKLFIAQPHWVLRKPKEFLLDLMNKYTALLRSQSPDGQLLETLTQSTVSLFTVQPGLADQIPSLGHLPAIFKSMKSTNDAVPRSAIQVIDIVSSNELCVRSLSDVDVIRPMMSAMEACPDIIVLACEALHQIFDKNQSALVEQALKAELVTYLLELLDRDLKALYKIENAPATKAQIVKALKAMTRDFAHGEKVNAILDESSVWASYKDQKHDLFISDRTNAGYLTGPMGVAGYLTQGAANPSNIPNKPPPIETHDDDDHSD